jgi:hypothetical protein
MKAENDSDTLFQALVDIKNILNETISSLSENIRRAQLQYLEDAFQQQKAVAAECLDGIDDQLIKLSLYIEEYQRLRASLKDLSDNKIPALGGTPPAMPDALGGETLAGILAARIDYLKAQGRV